MDSLRELTSSLKPALRDAVLAWADKNRVTKASLVPFCFSDNPGFAQALGVPPDATLRLWDGLVAHKDAWQEYVRCHSRLHGGHAWLDPRYYDKAQLVEFVLERNEIQRRLRQRRP